jgi:hypothetical protein
VAASCCPLDVVPRGAAVVLDGDPVALPGKCDDATLPSCGERAGGLFDVTMNMTEPRSTTTEPRIAQDHHVR